MIELGNFLPSHAERNTMFEPKNPLRIDIAAAYLTLAQRDVLEDKVFGDSEVGWYVRGEEIAVGYFSWRSSTVTFLDDWLKKEGYTSGTFTGDDAKILERLGTLRDYMRNDEDPRF